MVLVVVLVLLVVGRVDGVPGCLPRQECVPRLRVPNSDRPKSVSCPFAPNDIRPCSVMSKRFRPVPRAQGGFMRVGVNNRSQYNEEASSHLSVARRCEKRANVIKRYMALWR